MSLTKQQVDYLVSYGYRYPSDCDRVHKRIAIGDEVGTLTVLAILKPLKGSTAYALTECSCGALLITRSDALVQGTAKSCIGCVFKSRKGRPIIHGMKNTRLYTTWKNMKTRCYNENSQHYKYYGGKGITVCEDWLSFTAFMAWAKQAGYTDNLTIDRIDSAKGYSPANCQWLTMSENSRKSANERWHGRV